MLVACSFHDVWIHAFSQKSTGGNSILFSVDGLDFKFSVSNSPRVILSILISFPATKLQLREEITRGGLIENEEKSKNTREAVRIKQRKICVSAGNRTQEHSISATSCSGRHSFLMSFLSVPYMGDDRPCGPYRQRF